MSKSAAIIVLGPSGLDTAKRITKLLPGARIHGFADRVESTDESFTDTAAHLGDLFQSGTPIIGICAAGILIRKLAPLLDDKHTEPPVLAVAEDGSSVVPLLGGHHGANDLARKLAEGLTSHAAITTAGDLRFGVALDAPPPGWRLANPQHAKPFMAELLSGTSVSLDGAAPWLKNSELPLSDNGDLILRVTERAEEGDAKTLVYHPALLTLGIGCERGASAEEVIGLITETLTEAGLAPGAIAAVVSLDVKADEDAVHAAAASLGVPARFFSADRLEQERPRLQNPSKEVYREVGCHGVAEGAALAAAGPDAALIVAKRKSQRATCAIARATEPLDIKDIGKARGSLAIVSIGPGQEAWRTPEADALLAAASDIVGYQLYIDLLGAAVAGKKHHGFALGEEEDRVRKALDLAGDGRQVALIASGDAGIYAMASPLFELLEREAKPAWQRIEITVTPGISALQAAAARIGAPLGHDFCTISLSDLLTPWPVIEARVEAAAQGDFVIAFYNPVSKKRTTQLPQAREILLRHRPPTTPVVLARNLGRDAETITVTTLSDLDPATVDMLTVVLVGSSQTRQITLPNQTPRVYTPRGYANKNRPAVTDAERETPSPQVHFIGAGPGAADLITLRGRDLIAACSVCLYAGSLVPSEVVACAPANAKVIDTAPMTLDEIIGEMETAIAQGKSVARVHSGDPSLYGAIGEQMRRLDDLGIAYDITPGVPAYAAAAATLKTELTLPGISQTVVLTRTAMKASAMPNQEDLATLGASGATLAIHLSVRNLKEVTAELIPHYGADCPVAVVYRASWPDEQIIRGTLSDIRTKVRAAKITRTALVLVGRVLAPEDFRDSALYDPDHVHVLRPHRRA